MRGAVGGRRSADQGTASYWRTRGSRIGTGAWKESCSRGLNGTHSLNCSGVVVASGCGSLGEASRSMWADTSEHEVPLSFTAEQSLASAEVEA